MQSTGQKIVSELNSINLKVGQAALCWLGQHSFALKLGKTIVYIDPYLSPSSHRLFAPPVPAEELTNADIITGSHDHTDHIDRKVWPTLAAKSPNAVFVLPKTVKDSVQKETGIPENRLKGMNDGETIKIKDVTISAIPAAHEFLDYDEKTGLYPHLGFIFEGNGVTLYHSGDCCIYEGIQAKLRKWKIDIAMLPINGRDAERYARNCIGNMTYQEAADLAGTIKPSLTIPAHYDMFKGNSVDPQLFIDYMKVKYPTLKTMLMEHGKVIIYN
ncbi:MAG TPA: MBL fold metallo-hydrolase [Lentisphaeria bacterium]|nr:MAG: MBL fold metallo-hydrolase [Lentisphaerae bacterium GWF2_49_21]HBC87030.1 MBL fold metallo-hydrolase [Lentisphaeria bacterium]